MSHLADQGEKDIVFLDIELGGPDGIYAGSELNAFASASMQEDSFIELNEQRRENADITVITMINSCRKNPFSEKTGSLISNKSDSGHHHGFGMKSIERTIKRYNGEVQVYYDDKNFTFHTIIFLKDTSL